MTDLGSWVERHEEVWREGNDGGGGGGGILGGCALDGGDIGDDSGAGSGCGSGGGSDADSTLVVMSTVKMKNYR